MEERRPNHLLETTSPYLKQHAYNPVDWYPWGPEALERARREDKPIFLSIGYSTCHWCHVMAHESFENPAIAAIMNEHFVNIKVDREERPDLDETYMNVVQALTGHGGWPLSVFLTPDLKPFYGGTYFPPEDRGGLPGFPRLLLALSQAYQQNREQLTSLALKVESHVQRLGEVAGGGGDPTREALDGGGAAPPAGFRPGKRRAGRRPQVSPVPGAGFPVPLLSSLRGGPGPGTSWASPWRRWPGAASTTSWAAASTATAWTRPGWCPISRRCSTTMPSCLPSTWRTTGSPAATCARRVAAETLDFVLREMHAPQGGFYAAWDADSEGVEGKYYVWSLEEVEEVVGPEAAALVAAALGVTPEGNFEGDNVLTRPLSRDELAARFHLTAGAGGPDPGGGL